MDNTITLQNWWQLSSIQIGGAICLPVLILGQTLSQTYGFVPAVICILIGNAILLLLGLAAAKMSYENRGTTVENALEYFGEKGVAIFAATMAISLLGWFGIQLNMMSLGVMDLLSMDAAQPMKIILLNISLGLIATATALYGIRALNLLANISLPLLFAMIGYALYTAENKDIPIPQHSFSLAGVSVVIAMSIAVVIDLPTYFRHACSAKDGMVSILIIFGIATPLLQIVGVLLAYGTAGGTILDVLKRENATLWNLWVSLFLVLAGWTTNNLNLYSGVVCLAVILKKHSKTSLTLLFGLLGSLLACFNLLNHLEFVLDIMGVLVASIGVVIITRYLIMQYMGLKITSQDQKLHFLAWLLGVIIGFLSMAGFSLTSIAVLDSSLGASLGTLLILIPRGCYETTYN